MKWRRRRFLVGGLGAGPSLAAAGLVGAAVSRGRTPRLAEGRALGLLGVALMPIGAYDPWIRNHGNPEQAVTMADQAGARRFVPTHCSTFRLGDEPLDEPVARLEAALAREAGRRARRRPGEYRVAA